MNEAISAWTVPGQIDTAEDYRGVNDGVWVGPSAYANGPYGRCFNFDGTASLNCGDVYNLPVNGDLTFFCRAQWKVGSSQTVAYLGGQSNGYLTGYSAKFQNNADAGGFVGDNNGVSTAEIGAVSQGVWHDVLIRYDAASGESKYRIGNETDTVIDQATQTTAPEFWIGSRAGVLTLDGLGAEYAVWNRSLNDSEEAELIAGPEPSNESLPSIQGQVLAGEAVQIDPGRWKSHGNGTEIVVARLQSSPDGATGWVDAPGSTGVTSYAIPTSLSGQYLRAVSIATNSGGESDPAHGATRLVEESPPKWFVEAQRVRANGPAALRSRPTCEAVAALISS